MSSSSESSKPTPPNARPIPQKIDSALSTASSPLSPIQTATSPYTPDSTTASGDFFSEPQNTSAMAEAQRNTDSTILKRLSSFGRSSKRPRPQSTSAGTLKSSPPTSPIQPTTPTRKPSAKSPTTSTYTHVGRHSNEWLFNNISVRDTVKGVLFPKEGS
ncbi:MAG: hypothetical protein M1829_005700 [Trizodia sp. TS-e1964]|nr:MAG: hypothetical protein M1829_005700 [Trizodia sp. TS-e1964]